MCAGACGEKAVQAVRAKTQLRDQLKQQLAEQAGQLKKMQEEAASLLQATRSMTSKLRTTARRTAHRVMAKKKRKGSDKKQKASRSAQGKQRQDRRDGWTTRRRQVIKVPEGAVLRGCKKTRRKLREHGSEFGKNYRQERGVTVYLGAGNFSQGGWKAGAVGEQPSRPGLARPDRLVIVAQEPPPPAQDQPPAQALPGPVPRPQAPPWGRCLDRDTNPCLNFQCIGESMQRRLELCNYEGLKALPPIGKEYQQRNKLVNDRLPKVRQRLHGAAEYRRGIDGRARNNALEWEYLRAWELRRAQEDTVLVQARVRRTARSSCDLLNGLEMRHGAGVWGCITTPALEKMACIEKVKKEIVASVDDVVPSPWTLLLTLITTLTVTGNIIFFWELYRRQAMLTA
ncbi:hypothetical protein QJQ45_018153 [Haematococcus lacustris]|nr:hypothetical protein QJQ45_018153 [Haematococcus lacustris]